MLTGIKNFFAAFVPDSFLSGARALWREAVGTKPRRLYWVFLGLAFFFVWHGFAEGKDAFNRSMPIVKGLKISSSQSVSDILNLLMISGRLMAKLGSCLFGSFLLSLLLCNLIDDRIRPDGPSSLSQVELLRQMLSESGISSVYPSDPNVSIQSQSYATEVKLAAAMSKTIKMVSIAGFEYLGRGADSLLFNAIIKHPTADIEIILVDPENGSHVIDQRIMELVERDPTYDKKRIQYEINATIETLKKLRLTHKGKLTLSLIGEHPIFRLLIFEECLFVSTYAAKIHGHESPVFKITPKPNGGGFYSSLDGLFRRMKAESHEASLH